MNRGAYEHGIAHHGGRYWARTGSYASAVIALVAPVFFASGVLFAALKFPELSGRVVDEAELLSPSQAAEVTTKLAAHEQATTNQVVVVTLKSLQGNEIADFGYQLGRHWGIGQEGKDNGVLLIVAPTERKVRIEVGYGLEGTLTDALSKTIIEQEIVPRFKKGDMAGGIVAGAGSILAVLGGEYTPPTRVRSKDQGTSRPLFEIAVVLIIAALFIGTVLRDHINPTLAAALPAGGATVFGAVATDMFILWLVLGVLVFLFVRFHVPYLDKLGTGTDGDFWGGGRYRSGGVWGKDGGFGGGGGFSGGGGSFGGGGASGGW